MRVYRQSARVPAADSATADPADSLPPHCSQLYIRPDPEREFPFSDFSDFNTNSLCSINRFYSSPDLLVSPVEIHTLARICVSVVQGFLVSVVAALSTYTSTKKFPGEISYLLWVIKQLVEKTSFLRRFGSWDEQSRPGSRRWQRSAAARRSYSNMQASYSQEPGAHRDEGESHHVARCSPQLPAP